MKNPADMKVLLLSPLPPPAGGIATWTLSFRAYCEERNYPLQLVNTALTGSRGEQINSRRRLTDEIGRTANILKKMRQELKKEQPDVVHLNTSCSRFGIFRDALCVQIASRFDVPTVLHCHCNVQDQLGGKLGRTVFHSMCRKAAAVAVLNEKSYEFVKSCGPKKLYKVPNFIDESWLSQELPRRKESLKNILFVGHVQNAKGLQEMLAAAKRLPEITFTLVGPVKKEELDGRDIPENMVLTGALPREQVKEYLKTTDVFLFPSYSEGFATALTEAMAMGLPVIATDVGANAEMVENHGGIIVPVGDSDAVVAAIEQMRHACVRKDMAEWNREKVRRFYLRDQVMEALFRIYTEIL